MTSFKPQTAIILSPAYFRFRKHSIQQTQQRNVRLGGQTPQFLTLKITTAKRSEKSEGKIISHENSGEAGAEEGEIEVDIGSGLDEESEVEVAHSYGYCLGVTPITCLPIKTVEIPCKKAVFTSGKVPLLFVCN